MGLKKTTPAGYNKVVDLSKNDARMKKEADDQRRKARTVAKQQQAAEKVASASSQLAAGIVEASSARDQLSTAVSEIATGAEQAAGASQESLAAINQINRTLEGQLKVANTSSQKSDELRNLLSEMQGGIVGLVDNVRMASEKRINSAKIMNTLEEQAAQMNEAVKQVMRVADQTNLLALNAAIEAGRAGKHGKGFAVVADTVRTLAETAEKNATNIAQQIEVIQTKSSTIGEIVRVSAESSLKDVEKGVIVTQQLDVMKENMRLIYDGSNVIASASEEMNLAAIEVQKGSETIASAAEEQSSAAEEIVKTLEEQGVALTGAEQASQGLEVLADDLKNSTDIAKSSEEVAANAEQLSASVEEVNRSATEIMTAIGQISRGSEQASTAVEQAMSGINQLEKMVKLSEGNAVTAFDLVEKITDLLRTNKTSVEEMIVDINDALELGRENLKSILEVEEITRLIDKVTDSIGTVSVKTSMLAVNGAVEAARAGEYGKGFAVVSGDIQNLADDAAESVEQIKDLVKSIQEQATKMRFDLTEISDTTLMEVNKAKLVTQHFVNAGISMNEVLDCNEGVKNGSAEIATAVMQAKQGMEQIATAAEEASSNAQEAATAARQQSQGADELAVAIEEIASVADELQSI